MNASKHTYKGSCHCKAIQFEFDSEVEPTALQCNCSVCIRKNAIMSKQQFSPAQFRLICGKDALSVYHWNDKDVNHYFCKNCGIYPFHDSIYEPWTCRINLGCVDELDPRALEIEYFDGKHEL